MQQRQVIDVCVDQGTLALMLEVNRSTINRFQKIGMPYLAGDCGEKNQYDAGICVHWYCGNHWAQARKMSLTPIQKVLWAMAWGGDDRSIMVWKSRVLSQTERFRVPRESILLAIGFLDGAGLLPW